MSTPSRPRPEVGPCDRCGKATDCYVGHDVPEASFFCHRCNDEVMGWWPGFSALLALTEPPRLTDDLFGTLVGLKVKLDRPVDREGPCCLNICTIGAARGPHAGELICANCGQHRGWLSQTTARFIETVAKRFGAPTTPIVVRKAHTFEEEVPANEN
jgi:hypothetical protein